MAQGRRAPRSLPKNSVSRHSFKADYLRKRNKVWKQYDLTRPWVAQLYSSFFNVRPKQKIVDVGCGTGDFTRYLAKLGKNKVKILGIDANEDGVAAAITDTKKARLSGIISYKVGDAYRIPVDNDYADLTCCRTLLVHLTRPLDAVREMVRITRPGGTVAVVEGSKMGVFHDPSDPEYTRLSERQLEAWLRGIKKLDGRVFSIGERLPGIFKEAGLKDIRAEIQADAWVSSDPRRKLRDVKDELRFAVSAFKERQQANRRYLLAGGMPRRQVDRYDRLSLAKMEELLSDNDKLRADASFSAATLFLVAGSKRV